MVEAFGKVQSALTGALIVAQSLFEGIPGSVQMIISATALSMVVKYFIVPIVGVSSVLGGASDQVKVSKGLDRRSMAKSARKGK